MRKVGVDKTLNYADIPVDEDGWADAKEFMPADYDLCLLKIKDKKTQSGWASGLNWDGLKVKDEDEVLYWKKQREPKEGVYAPRQR